MLGKWRKQLDIIDYELHNADEPITNIDWQHTEKENCLYIEKQVKYVLKSWENEAVRILCDGKKTMRFYMDLFETLCKVSIQTSTVISTEGKGI